MKIVRLEKCDGIVIRYRFIQTPFGAALVASTDTGVCYMGFDDSLKEIETRFAGATLQRESDKTPDFETLHLHGTDFQLQVWSELIKIPKGKTTTYQELAKSVGRPKAYRAVGTAVGRNPVSLIVPCHRVVASNGGLGGYYWGVELKKKILESEI